MKQSKKIEQSQILPRDFDLSPNFEIIKFNIIKNKKFNYRNLLWEKEEQKPGARTDKSNPSLKVMDSIF